jgi:plasmid maintenance system killer protein
VREKRVNGQLDMYKQIVYIAFVIQSFADNETEHFYTTGKSRRLAAEIRIRANMRLTQLNAATRIEDLRLPSSHYVMIVLVNGAYASTISGEFVFVLRMVMHSMSRSLTITERRFL